MKRKSTTAASGGKERAAMNNTDAAEAEETLRVVLPVKSVELLTTAVAALLEVYHKAEKKRAYEKGMKQAAEFLTTHFCTTRNEIDAFTALLNRHVRKTEGGRHGK